MVHLVCNTYGPITDEDEISEFVSRMHAIEFTSIDECQKLYRLVYKSIHTHEPDIIPDDYPERLATWLHLFPDDWKSQLPEYSKITMSNNEITNRYFHYRNAYKRIIKEYQLGLSLNLE